VRENLQIYIDNEEFIIGQVAHFDEIEVIPGAHSKFFLNRLILKVNSQIERLRMS
jgi:hypothetical protein